MLDREPGENPASNPCLVIEVHATQGTLQAFVFDEDQKKQTGPPGRPGPPRRQLQLITPAGTPGPQRPFTHYPFLKYPDHPIAVP